MKRKFHGRKHGMSADGCGGPAILLVVFTLFLVAGCTDPGPQITDPEGRLTPTANTAVMPPGLGSPQAQTSPQITGLPPGTGAVTPDPSDPFERGVPNGILIRGINDVRAGHPLNVSGRTSLPAGTKIIIRIVPVIMKNGDIAGDYTSVEKSTTTTVTGGSANGNRFSVTLDSTGLRPAEHILSVTDAADESPAGGGEPSGVTATSLFIVLPP